MAQVFIDFVDGGGNAHGMMGFVHNMAFFIQKSSLFFTEFCLLHFQYVEQFNFN
jgi:hypothetical protein